MFKLSWDGKSWQEVDRNLDGLFAPDGPARYRYFLKCELSGDARLRRLKSSNDLQMAPLTLPGMGVGTNAFTYTDESASDPAGTDHPRVGRAVRDPAARAAGRTGLSTRRGVAEGTEIVFQWRPASDPDGDAIADYHFELSERADMKWPLSMSFAKLISRTADAGQARYTLPGPGLLNPDTKYFWRVRRKMRRVSGGPGAQPGASRRGDRRRLVMSASNSTASATGASCAGRPARWAASLWHTVSMPATRRASPSATGPTSHGGRIRQDALEVPGELRGRNPGH